MNTKFKFEQYDCKRNAEAKETLMSEMTLHTVHGISFVERAGRGPSVWPCVVFLHGIGANAGSFRALFDQLPPALHLLAWTAPGYGTSKPLAQTWPTADDYAVALAEFLDARRAGAVSSGPILDGPTLDEPVILVGHSLGTLIGAAFARAYPVRVARLILASCAQGYGVPVGGEMPPTVAARITDLQDLGLLEFARARAPRLVYRPEANPDVVATVQDGMYEVNPDGYAQAVRMLASGDLSAMLSNVSVPCHFITGAEDQVTPPAQTLAAAEAWASAHGQTPQVAQISQAGHAVYVQRPAAFAATLMRLLDAPNVPAPTPTH